MKTILVLSILFSAVALPAFAELTVQDLEKIRQIVKKSEIELKSEIEKTNSKLDAIDTRLRNVETDLAELRGRSSAFSLIKDWGIAICALGALIVSIIALRKKQPKLPQTAQDAPKTASQ